MERAKVFWSGRSQAVRLPRKFRFTTGEVRIRRQGRAVILEPLTEDWTWLDELTGFDSDVASAVKEQVLPQERPALDEFFS